MANRRSNDLSYGHLGSATYDTKERKWIFGRQSDRSEFVVFSINSALADFLQLMSSNLSTERDA